MIIIDAALKELEKKGTPIRVGLVGTGFAGRGFALQLLTGMPGMRLAAICNRTRDKAKKAIKDAVGEKSRSACLITADFKDLTQSPDIDVVVEATGEPEYGANVVMSAIENKKHVVLINAELDATVGPILKRYADEAGVIYTQADGDQPAKLMNLVREVQFLGFKPVMAGNIKSLIDFRRTPKTQKKWSAEHFQDPKMPTSFADGTKISIEMATIANATGFRVGKRNMYGPSAKHVDEASKLFPREKLMNGGLVDYLLGAEPSFGIFVLGYSIHPIKNRYMKVYKMGEGPLYTFYTPYHLSPLEAPISVARAVLYKDAALAPLKGPVCDVISLAKFDLKNGTKLDGIGGFTVYGAIENYDISRRENLLPIGLADGSVLKHDIKQDSPITYNDVELPSDRLIDKLRKKQDELFK